MLFCARFHHFPGSPTFSNPFHIFFRRHVTQCNTELPLWKLHCAPARHSRLAFQPPRFSSSCTLFIGTLSIYPCPYTFTNYTLHLQEHRAPVVISFSAFIESSFPITLRGHLFAISMMICSRIEFSLNFNTAAVIYEAILFQRVEYLASFSWFACGTVMNFILCNIYALLKYSQCVSMFNTFVAFISLHRCVNDGNIKKIYMYRYLYKSFVSIDLGAPGFSVFLIFLTLSRVFSRVFIANLVTRVVIEVYSPTE